ncbi:MAG: ATP-binding cassette domain-containing protein [Treponema sp.]|nr:ATP-binding cassette domain-containing protein [Treponema sp.]
MKTGEAWLLTGPNGGGKADFLEALANGAASYGGAGGKTFATGGKHFVPNLAPAADGLPTSGLYANAFENSIEVVSLERAARLIQEERENDESEFVEGGVDIGRTGRIFIAEALCGKIKRGQEIPPQAKGLENLPEIKLCGVEKILDRGLKYMSTGEIRRTLLARALFSRKKLLVLSDPFAGLDVESRKILLDFFNTIASRQLDKSQAAGDALSDSATQSPASASGEKREKVSNPPSSSVFPRILLCMERYTEIPSAITHVLEFSGGKMTFAGARSEYEALLEKRKSENKEEREKEREEFRKSVIELSREVDRVMGVDTSVFSSELPENLIEMHDVNVGWGDTRVLKNLNWTLKKGQHWLIRGPNGSGKTTLLELITGDNQQVFCNDVRLFGARRGSGETIWDIKHKLGIVSYRMHVEYRMVSSSLREVIMSGFHDSIGLYQTPGDVEIEAAEKWLKLGGFEGRGRESFNSLSYGEQRAILILRAAVKCPPVMILDEPCHGLDDAFREKILSLLEIIAQSGTTTMLHVTHEESEVLSCEHHVLTLLPGQEPMYKVEER